VGEWTPKGLPGLALWLDDDVGVESVADAGTLVRRWRDQSGNQNDAVSDKGRPIETKVLNNAHDAFECGTGNLQVAGASSLDWGAADFAIAVVARWDAHVIGDIYVRRYADTPSGSFGLEVNGGDGALQIRAGNQVMNANPPPDLSRFHLLMFKGQHPLAISIDGLTKTGQNGDANTMGHSLIDICGGLQAIAELVAAKGALAPTDETRLTRYLNG
jgi:hypothetical protein